MNSLVRPRTASPNSPSIKHARSLSPRSVVVEYKFPEDRSDSQELQHLQHPLQENHLDYDNYFRECSIGIDVGIDVGIDIDIDIDADDHNNNNNTLRPNKRKLLSADLQPRRVTNLRHRQTSNETMKWLVGYNSDNLSPSTTHPVSDTDDYDDSSLTTRPRKEQKISFKATVRQPVEELWLGPMFESSQTVLTSIASLPISVTHLDLDLRNALHLLPQAMPLLFGKHHLKTLSLRVFGDAGAVELAKWMNHNPNLERLDLRGNRIGSMGARAIVDAIKACSCDIQGVVVRNAINQSHHHNLTHLNLSYNCILHGDMIGELLATNSTLEALDLGFNWLGNEEVEDICIGLCENTSLRELNLYGCHRISHTGMKYILDCLQKNNTSLHKVGLQAFDEEGERLIEEINYWLKLNKAGRYMIKTSLASPLVSSEQDIQNKEQQQPSHNGHREQAVPTGLWPLVLEKSNMDPESIFHLVREGFGAKIINHR